MPYHNIPSSTLTSKRKKQLREKINDIFCSLHNLLETLENLYLCPCNISSCRLLKVCAERVIKRTKTLLKGIKSIKTISVGMVESNTTSKITK